MYDYDLMVIGSGPGGQKAAIAAAKPGCGPGRDVRVRTPDPHRLREALTELGMAVTVAGGTLRVVGGKIELIGEAAAEHGIVLHELSPQQGSLEQAYMLTTGQDVQFHARPAPEPLARGKVGPS